MVKLDDLIYNIVMSVPKYRKRYLFVLISSLITLYMANKKRIGDIISGKAQMERRLKYKRRSSTQGKVGVNAEFLMQLRILIPICVPGMK